MAVNFEMLKNLLVKPQEILLKLEREKIETAIVIMVLNWVLVALSFGIILNFQYSPAILVAGIILNLVAAFLIHVALNTIGGKGNFKNALDSTTYPYFGVAFVFLIFSLISKIMPSVATTFIVALSILLSSIYFIIGFAGSFRMLKDTFKLDLITVWIVTSIIALSIITAVYANVLIFQPNLLQLLTTLR